ncbi:hypothetical protein V6N13_065279 [Hibiscus sabdariffa]
MSSAYFQELFGTSSPIKAIDILNLVQPRVTEEHNQNLLASFQPDEIRLSLLLNDANRQGTIRGASIGRSRLQVGHLFFADDSILFGEATVSGASTLIEVLSKYGAMSGQRVNYDKSLVFFSSNVGCDDKTRISSVLGVRISNNPERYLGLPTTVGRHKKEAFSYFLDRFYNKLDNWGIRSLSMEGREVQIKAVLQVIPVYAMQVFLLPATLCRSLEQVMAKV